MEVQMTNSISPNLEREIRDSFKMISFLLQYPDNRWFQWRELVEEVQQFENPDIQRPLLSFLGEIGGITLDDIEQQYVDLFDFNPSCSLSMSYLKAGEKRERGQILVDLKSMYRNFGYDMTDEELSDYLPVVLEFVSVAPLEIAVNLMNSFREPIEKLQNELEKLGTPYALLINACISLNDLLDKTILLGERG